MRACVPSDEGFVERQGVKIHYEVYGDGRPTILLLPTWTIIHQRIWKMQVPYLSRHFRHFPRSHAATRRRSSADQG